MKTGAGCSRGGGDAGKVNGNAGCFGGGDAGKVSWNAAFLAGAFGGLAMMPVR